jgi:hypothetical protein
MNVPFTSNPIQSQVLVRLCSGSNNRFVTGLRLVSHNKMIPRRYPPKNLTNTCMFHNPNDLWRLAHMFTLILRTISVMPWRMDFYICYLLRNIWMIHGRIDARLPSRTKRRTQLPSTSHIQRSSFSSGNNYGLFHIARGLSGPPFLTCLGDQFEEPCRWC